MAIQQIPENMTGAAASALLFANDTELDGKIPRPWVAQAYPQYARVLYLGRTWEASTAATAANVPNSGAPVWVEYLTGYYPKQLTDILVNMFPNSNSGMAKAVVPPTASVPNTSDVFHFAPQAGTPVSAYVGRYETFNNVVKMDIKVADRVVIYSPVTALANSPLVAGDSVAIGFFLKVPATYTSPVSASSQLAGSSAATVVIPLTYVSLSNGWRYYSGTVAVTAGQVAGFRVFISLDNSAVGAADGSLYFSSPVLLKSQTKPAAAIYRGYDLSTGVLDYSLLNILPNTDTGLSSALLNGATTADSWNFKYQAGTPTAEKMAGFNGFNCAIKMNIKAGDRINVLSPVLNFNNSIVATDALVNFGFWLKVPSNLSFAPAANFAALGGTSPTTVALSYVTLGNGWRYYTFTNARVVPTALFAAGCMYLNFTNSSANDAELYFAAPALLKTSEILPDIYRGVEPSSDTVQVLKTVFGETAGFKFCSFGDSITAANGWQPFINAKFGFIHYIRGIGGSGVSTGTQIAYVDANGLYLDRPPNPQPVGSFTILSQAYQQQRVDTIPLDSNLIFILFGTNDVNKPLGAVTDAAGTDSFFGRYFEMLNKIYTRLPAAEIVLGIPTFRSDENLTTVNMTAIRAAIFEIGKKYAYRVVDVGGQCGINLLNSGVFLADGVHPTTQGYEKMARVIVKEFQNVIDI